MRKAPYSCALAACLAAVVVVAGSLAGAAPAAALTEEPAPQPPLYPMVFPVGSPEAYFADDDLLGFGACRDGCSRSHEGIDILAPKMTPVYAVADATVFWLGSNCCSVFLRHDDGWQTWYIHLNNDTPGTDDGAGWGIAEGVVPGARVTAGQLIGWVGDSGNAEDTSPHLHFELVDPAWVKVDPYPSVYAAFTGAACMPVRPAPLSTLLASANLRRGARGQAVSELQGFLKVKGYRVGMVDGVLGGITEAAVRVFQQRQGLYADGVVGPATRGVVQTLAADEGFSSIANLEGRILQRGMRGGDVAELQRFLVAQGYSVGTVDGIFGRATEAGVRAFQQAKGLGADGQVGRATRLALLEGMSLVGPAACPAAP